MKDANTKKPRSERTRAGMRTEYDISGGVRSKYADRLPLGVNVVLLEPELVEAFPDSNTVDDVLRVLLAIATLANQGQRVQSLLASIGNRRVHE